MVYSCHIKKKKNKIYPNQLHQKDAYKCSQWGVHCSRIKCKGVQLIQINWQKLANFPKMLRSIHPESQNIGFSLTSFSMFLYSSWYSSTFSRKWASFYQLICVTWALPLQICVYVYFFGECYDSNMNSEIRSWYFWFWSVLTMNSKQVFLDLLGISLLNIDW